MHEKGNSTVNDDSRGTRSPAFSATVHEFRGAPVVEVLGEIDLATTPELLEAIGRAGSRMDGRPILVVDLRAAGFIDASGTRALVEQAHALRELGGELRTVLHEGGPVARVFELLEVGRAQGLYHDLAEATRAGV